MRSRLEARWAAFFDSIDWPWMYEPFDLDGYIPDFAIEFDPVLLVEVRPPISLPELHLERPRIERAGWPGEAMIVGGSLHALDAANPILGILGERIAAPDGLGWYWDDARLFECLSCSRSSVLHEAGSWRCRRCGSADGNAHVGAASFRAEWIAAGNRVQWRPGS